MTFNEARAAIRTLGYTITKRDGGEYRVNIAGGKEDTAYYTNDLEDAMGTARAESARKA